MIDNGFEFEGGWIYVVMTSSDYERFKLGRTRGNPLDRAKKLRTGDPHIALLAAYFIPKCLPLSLSKVEAALHQEFQDERICFHDEAISEWFLGYADTACQLIEGTLESWFSQRVTDMSMLDKGRICRAYESDLECFYGPPPELHPLDGLPM